ncbi:C80 family cysteine peptidase [Methylococcus sp. EFPC2]|uniref:C80 family cysteine peptidase n=1 Tax=Methylococcus sp. EFPC2 TaxID=2812648 RepID=UPI001967532C|nr:C80 family cysteine peptidase [Methylococcus sp. EFPC2]QSA95846.1 hypothetical protein JWZ97_11400 [Methylococcus sp. EFPC2]
MKNADKYYILQIVKETDAGDETIYKNTDRLIGGYLKKYNLASIPTDNIVLPSDYIDTTWFFLNNSQIIYKKAGLSMRLKGLTDHSELIIRGHGDVNNNRVSRVSAEVLARSLIELGLQASCRINITGCNLGRNSNISGNERGTKSAQDVGAGSFAALFQKELYRLRGLRNRVHARTAPVTVLEDGRKETFDFASETNGIHHQAHSKIVFTIDSVGVQNMQFAY